MVDYRTGIIDEALMGQRGEVQKAIAETGLDWVETILKKNKDYGNSVFKKPILLPSMGVGRAILVRMSDKIERLRNLADIKDGEVKESKLDTISDLGAYCLLYLVGANNEDIIHTPDSNGTDNLDVG